MAVTAREVLLIFRGQNYLSSAIRRVGADVGGLSRGQQLANQRAQLQIAGQRLRNTRSIAQAELQSINVGSRRLSQEKAIAAQKLAQMRADSTLIKNQQNLSMLTRRVATRTSVRGYTLQETEQLRRAAEITVAADTAAISNQSLAVQKLEADEARLVARRAQLNEIINTSSRGIDLNTQKLDQNTRAINALPWQRFSDGAAKVEHAGRVIQMFGLITGAAMGYAAEQSAKFNTSITLAATQSTTAANNTAAGIQRNARSLQNSVQQMLAAGRTAASPGDLTNALYQIFSGLSFKGSQASQLRQGLSILREFNKVFTANYGQVQFNDVVSAGINLMNNFGISANRLPQILNRMQASVRFGATNMADFVSSLSQVVPAYRSAHYSFNQLAKDVAFVSRLFPQSLRTGTTGLARLSEMFARPNVIQGIQQQFGVNIAPQGQLLPINKIIQELVHAKPDIFATSQAIGSFFKNVGGTQGTIQARRVLAGFVQEMGLYRTVARQVANDNNEVGRSYAVMRKTPQVELQAFLNQLRAVVLTLGAGAIPAFRGFVAPIEAAVKWFDQLNPRTQRFIGYAIAMSGIIALLGGSFLAVVGGLGRLVGMLGVAIKFMGRAGGLASEAGAVRAEFALGLGIPGLIGLLVVFHKQVGDVVNLLGGLRNAITLVVVAFAAWKLASYITDFALIATRTATLATGITEIGTAAKIATVETVGLRGALLGIAGMTVTAFILVKEDKTATSAIRNAFGDTLQKEIDARTGRPRGLSFGQQVGQFLTRPDLNLRGLTMNFGRDLLHPTSLLTPPGWQEAMRQASSEQDKLSIAYRGFLSLLGRRGSPTMLKVFSEEMQRAHLTTDSGAASLTSWLSRLRRAATGTQGIRLVSNQLEAIHKAEFRIARQDPFADMNNRLVQAHGNAVMLAQGLDRVKKANRDIGKAAVQMGVVATPSFKQLYINLLQAKLALKGHEGDVARQRALLQAQAALQQYVSKEQYSAANKASTAAANITPAWQAATQQGIVATATYTKLYDAVQRAQKLMERNPTVANQRAYLDAQRALDNYVQDATQSTQRLAQTTKVSMQDVVNSVTQMYQQLLQQNQTNFGTLFQGPFIQSPQMQNYLQYGGKLTGPQLTKDLQSQIGQFRNFNRLLANLQRRGAPAELISQLRAMGPQAIDQIRALTRMSGPELQRYFGLFKKAQQEIHKQTMHDLNRQLHDYLRYGRNIGKQMAAGIRQEAPAITKAIEAMVRRAFGGNVAGRGGRGGHNMHGGGNGGVHHHHHHNHHDHYHTHGRADSRTDTATRHQRFRNRNKHRRRRHSGDRYGG